MINSKILFALICLTVFYKSQAQSISNYNQELLIGITDSLYSETLQEQRDIWIHIPEQVDSTKYYPVIYLLDATEHFHIVTGMIKKLAQWDMPESIVVGILNTDRTRDFTPTRVDFSRGHNTEESGGSHKFISFIDRELKPYINNKYQTENNSTIIGHSTAGLFVIYAYLHHEASFDNYIAIDPSLWWDNENLVLESQEILTKQDRKTKSLYVAVANSIGENMDTVKVRKDRSEVTEQIRANLNFRDILTRNSKNLNYTWEYYKNEDHGSITVPAQYNGLRTIFDWFPFPELWRFNTPKKYTISELIDPFYLHYKKLSIHLKKETKPDWNLVNDIATFMLEGHKLPIKSLAYLEMNIKFYPENSKSYLSLGNFYKSQKDLIKAVENYKKAINIDGSQEAKNQLAKIE